jgi:hypothetical protein
VASLNAKANTGQLSLDLVLEHSFCKDLYRNFSNVSARTDRLLALLFSFEKTARVPVQGTMKFSNERTQEVKKWVIERIEHM